MSQLKRLVIVSTLFQLVWFMTVLGRESWQWWTILAVGAALALSTWHDRFNWRVWLVLTLAGIALDSLNVVAGVLIFETKFLPVWLMALWAAFCWYAQFLCRALSQYPLWFVSIVGGLAGALSYLAGYKLGAVSLGYSLPVAFVVFFIEWTLFVLLCLKMINVGAKSDEREEDNMA